MARMRHMRWRATTVALALALVLAQCVQLCTALPGASDGCTSDTIERHSGPLPVTAAKGAPGKRRNAFQAHTVSVSYQWTRLYINQFLQDPDKSAIVCQEGRGKHNITNMFGHIVPCIPEAELNKYNRDVFRRILWAASSLHMDRLIVESAWEPIVVPNLEDVAICNKFAIPESHRTSGVSGEMVLYAAPTPLRRTAPFIYESCAQNAKGRPTVGVVAFDLLSFLDFGFHRASVRFLAHAIAHTLGFSYKLMKEKGMIETREIRGQQDAPIMTSPAVKQAARKHYGCDSLEGMEMKNRRGLESHWKRRNALDELMSLPLPRPGDSFLGLYTELTLSAFEDLGFYKARFEMAEPMKWGKDAGCEFMTYVCKDSTENKFPAMFCDPGANREVHKCSSDRASFGACSASPAMTVDTLWTEFCPIVKAKTRCDKHPNVAMPGHLFSPNSWCVDAQALTVASDEADSADSLEGVCAEVQCRHGMVMIKYAGAHRFEHCPEGASINVKSNVLRSGRITCPKYEEVCMVTQYGGSRVRDNY